MPIQAVDVSTILDDEDLYQYDPAIRTRQELAPDEWQKTTLVARQYALDRTLEALRRRVPPIRYSDLASPEELRLTIIFGALEHLYELAMTSEDSVHGVKRRLYAERFEQSINGLSPTLSNGERGPNTMIPVSRR